MLKALNVPLSVQRNARKGLELRKLYGRGGTPIGEASAKKLSSGKISLKFAKHVANYFPRHAGDNLEQTEKSDKGPSNGYIAWLLWGGDEARDWLEKRVKGKQMGKTKRKQNSPFLTMPDRATAEAFAEAARKAGHTNVFVSGHKGKVGVLLGAMSGLKANELLDKLRAMKKNPKLELITVDTSKQLARVEPDGDAKGWALDEIENGKHTGDLVSGPFSTRVKAIQAATNILRNSADYHREGLVLTHYTNAVAQIVPKHWIKANPSLPPNASAQQIYAKMQQLSRLKSTLENKGTRKDFVKAERIGQQMKALAKKHQQALSLKANPPTPKGYMIMTGRNGQTPRTVLLDGIPVGEVSKVGKHWKAVDTGNRNHGDRYIDDWAAARQLVLGLTDADLRSLGVKRNPSLRGLLSKAKASLKKLTPSGRRSLAAIKRLQEASLSDPLGKTKRMILETRKSKNPKLGPKKETILGFSVLVYRDGFHQPFAAEVQGTAPNVERGREIKRTVAHALGLELKDVKVMAKKANPWSKGERVEGPEIHYSGPSARHAGAHNYGAYQAGREWRKSANYYSSGSPLYFGRWWDAHPKADGMTKAEAKKFWTLGVKSASPYSKKRSNPKHKPSRKRNSASASAELYEKFHGKPSTSILEIEEEWHIHKNLAQLGTLVEIKVLLNPTESKSNQRRATLAVPHSDNPLKGVQLCSSENARKTLYLVGGDQSLPLKALGFTAADEKDLMYIGEIEEITYRTRKHFDQFKKIDYYHGLGEVTKVRPQLLYRSRDKKLLIAGGQYDVRPEGIVN